VTTYEKKIRDNTPRSLKDPRTAHTMFRCLLCLCLALVLKECSVYAAVAPLIPGHPVHGFVGDTVLYRVNVTNTINVLRVTIQTHNITDNYVQAYVYSPVFQLLSTIEAGIYSATSEYLCHPLPRSGIHKCLSCCVLRRTHLFLLLRFCLRLLERKLRTDSLPIFC
jgi:hypothetical protein